MSTDIHYGILPTDFVEARARLGRPLRTRGSGSSGFVEVEWTAEADRSLGELSDDEATRLEGELLARNLDRSAQRAQAVRAMNPNYCAIHDFAHDPDDPKWRESDWFARRRAERPASDFE